MTIDEILATEIPEGKYSCAMHFLRTEIQIRLPQTRGIKDDWDLKQEKIINNLSAAFEALMELAEGVSFVQSYDNAASEERKTFENSRLDAIREILEIVEGMEKENFIIPYTYGREGYEVTIAKGVIKIFKQRTSKLTVENETA